MRTGDYNDGAQLQDTSHHISSKHIRLEGVCGFGFLGIELDIFIIEVNLTRDSSKIQNVFLEGNIYKVPEAWDYVITSWKTIKNMSHWDSLTIPTYWDSLTYWDSRTGAPYWDSCTI